MDTKTIEAGRRVADKLKPAQTAIDDAMLAWSGTLISIIAAGRETNQAQYVTQKLIDNTVATLETLRETRLNAVKVHSEIVRVKGKLGLDAVGYGCYEECLIPFGSDQHTAPAAQAA